MKHQLAPVMFDDFEYLEADSPLPGMFEQVGVQSSCGALLFSTMRLLSDASRDIPKAQSEADLSVDADSQLEGAQ